jgi:hypothetical protein
MMGQVCAALGLVVHLMLDQEHLMLGLMFDRLIMGETCHALLHLH